MAHFVWYLEKEIRCDIETLLIDRVLTEEHFCGKIIEKNVSQKLARDLFLILLNNPKHSLHGRHSFKNKIFWKKIIKKTSKS